MEGCHKIDLEFLRKSSWTDIFKILFSKGTRNDIICNIVNDYFQFLKYLLNQFTLLAKNAIIYSIRKMQIIHLTKPNNKYYRSNKI